MLTTCLREPFCEPVPRTFFRERELFNYLFTDLYLMSIDSCAIVCFILRGGYESHAGAIKQASLKRCITVANMLEMSSIDEAYAPHGPHGTVIWAPRAHGTIIWDPSAHPANYNNNRDRDY